MDTCLCDVGEQCDKFWLDIGLEIALKCEAPFVQDLPIATQTLYPVDNQGLF